MCDFAVVIFEDGSLSEVPTKWLCSDNEMCWWPQSKNVSSLISKNAQPDPDNWEKFKCKVERFCATLEKARKVAEDSNYTTENDEMQGRGKRLKKPSRQILKEQSEISSEEEDCTRKLEKAPCFVEKLIQEPVLLENTQATKMVEDNVDQNHSGLLNLTKMSAVVALENNAEKAECSVHTNNIHNGLEELHINGVGSSISIRQIMIEKNLNKLIKMVTHLQMQVTEISQMLQHQKINLDIDEFEDIRKMIPIKNVDELKFLENFIQKEENKIKMLQFIKKIGGSSIKDNLNRIYKLLFTNEFSVQCSWLGLRNNIRISSSSIISLVNGAVSKSFSVQDKDFETISSEWFRHARQRLQREVNKM